MADNIAVTSAAATATQKKQQAHGPRNHVRISLGKNKFTFVDLTKYLLHEGEKYVELAGMGDAIGSVVEVAEILKAQNLVNVLSIETSRAPERPNGIQVDRLKVRVSKSDDFARVFAEQMEEKKKRKEIDIAAAAAAAVAVSASSDSRQDNFE